MPAADTRPEPFPDTATTGVRPRRAQVRAFGGRSVPPRPRLWRPAPRCPRPASAAATDTPTSCSPAAGAPLAPGPYPARTSPRHSAAPAPAAPCLQRSGHHHRDISYSRRRHATHLDHAGAPSVIRQTDADPDNSISVALRGASHRRTRVHGPGHRLRVITKAVGDRGGIGTMRRPNRLIREHAGNYPTQSAIKAVSGSPE